MTRWLADTQAIAHLTGRKPATVRSWAFRGLLIRRGTGKHGRALYDVEEAERLAMSLTTLENRDAMCNTEPSAGACPQAGLDG